MYIQTVACRLTVFVSLATCYVHVVVGHKPDQVPRRISVLLITAPLPGHANVAINLGEELALRGHNATFFTVEPKGFDILRKRVENSRSGMQYRSAESSLSYNWFQEYKEQEANSNGSLWFQGEILLGREVLNRTYVTWDKRELSDWDILITEDLMSPVALFLSQKWKVPLIVVGNTLQFISDLHPPWPFPSLASGLLSDNLDFSGRLLTVFHKPLAEMLVTLIMRAMLFGCAGDSLITTQLAHSIGTLVPHVVPTAIGFEFPRPLSPLTTYTGPILSPLIDPLPEDIQVWLDSHPTGSVVYISMGSLAFITHQVARAIVESLNATGYSAVWSLRKKNRAILDGLELNDKKILLLDWAPQLAILRHRSIKMAILHGGMNGVHEALHSGVPMIVIPVFGDQFVNTARVVHNKLGVMLDHNGLTGEKIAEHIRSIEKGNYHKNVARLSKIFHHAEGVTKAADLVEFYAEVGYDHLIPAYARYEWSWIQYYNVDVYLLLLIIGGLVVWIMSWLCKCCCEKSCRCVGKFQRKTKVD